MNTQPWSIRTRLAWGVAVVLAAFLTSAGWAVRQAYLDSLTEQRYARLQTTAYLLMAAAEIDAQGVLVMPASLVEPRLSLPGSGLYAAVSDGRLGVLWQSGSALGRPGLALAQPLQVGQWHYGSSESAQGGYLRATYGVRWAVNEKETPLVFTVLEDRAGLLRELHAFERSLWLWLGGAGVLLLLAQALLLRWGLLPLGRLAREIGQIEQGRQSQLQGSYPREIAGLGANLNLLIGQERARQTRYKDALDDLAHSLKTPLAVLRASLDQGPALPQVVAQQVARMDDIVVHQLGRAAVSGAARFAPHLLLAPVARRILDSLAKVYADKRLQFELDCAGELSWRIDEGDAFELLGNLLDNAAKWADRRVSLRIWQADAQLHMRIQDDGPGFADLQTLPQRRVRLDEQVPGHGIGLSVAQDLVASHQGQLLISSAPGGGAQVDIVLTAAPPPRA